MGFKEPLKMLKQDGILIASQILNDQQQFDEEFPERIEARFPLQELSNWENFQIFDAAKEFEVELNQEEPIITGIDTRRQRVDNYAAQIAAQEPIELRLGVVHYDKPIVYRQRRDQRTDIDLS